MEQLSKNFTLQELTHTNTGIDNTPNENQKANLKLLCENVLQPVRELYGKPIKVNSGFRSWSVNNAVGGKIHSQHRTGEAADISCKDNKKLFELIKDNCKFDQLINEKNYSWIHVSYSATKNRGQILSL